MTRALTVHEVQALDVLAKVARIAAIGTVEIGEVVRVTPTQVVVSWLSECGFVRYARETGRRLGCPGEVLRAVDEKGSDVEHVATELGDDVANIEPNDEAEILATVKADRRAAKRLNESDWFAAVQAALVERLGWDNATASEEAALQAAMSVPGTEPQQILARHLAKREAPYYTASQLAAWVYRQRRAKRQAPAAAAPDFASW